MKRIKDYPNYLITCDGRVFSLKTDKWLKPQKGINGHQGIALFKDGKQRNKFIKNLVAMHFEIEGTGTFLYHVDGDKKNNSVENLRRCEENVEAEFRNQQR